MADVEQTSTPKVKVVAATGGAAIGSPISVIVLWLLTDKIGLELTPEVSAAFNALLTAFTALAAGYLTPPGPNETSAVTANGAVVSAIKTDDPLPVVAKTPA